MASPEDGGSADRERIRQEVAGAVIRVSVLPPAAESLDPTAHDHRTLRSLSKRMLIALAALLVIALAGTLAYAYASPYLTVARVRRAAAAGDADTINAHVDFPALRESIKSWMGLAITHRMARSDTQNNPFAGVGEAVATTILDGLVAAMVTPEMLRLMLEGQRPQPRRPDGSQRAPASPPDADLEMGYESLNRFVVKVHDKRTPANEFAMVWHRAGFTWKLSAIRLPMPE